jgi:hypothetical protein
MKFIRFLFIAALMSIATAAFAESDAQKSFEKLKALAGSWTGPMQTAPKEAGVDGEATHVTLRVTSMGNALMHEMTGAGRPDDPITMLYLDADQLSLTHFCDAGNRPRMTATTSADGKTIEFHFVDVAGSTKYGHMHGATFTIIDADHHTEDWMYMTPGNKMVHAHVELHRTK